MMTGRAATANASGASFKIIYRTNGLLMASSGVVCAAIWTTKPTKELFEIQRAHLSAAVLRDPGRALFLCVVDAKADPPEQEVREASAQMVNAHGSKLAGCALVVEGSGFRAAITRTVLSGITLLVRTPVPLAFFESVASACPWLEKRGAAGATGDLPASIELARTVESPVA